MTASIIASRSAATAASPTPKRPEHLRGRFAQARHQESALARRDHDGKERPLGHAEDKLRTGKEQMRVPVTQLR